MNLQRIKIAIFLIIIFAPLVIIHITKGPIPQNQLYHQFADQRTLLDIPNFFDVISNLVFLITGALGIQLYRNHHNKMRFSWLVFFTGVFLVAPGSAYYHLNPNNFTLIWDRLPMTIGFTAILVALLSEKFIWKNEKIWLLLLALLGIYSIVHWQLFADLRLYMWVQLSAISGVLMMAILFRSEDIRALYLMGAFSFYIFAKMTETYDIQIFAYSKGMISGHTLKHLLAGVAIHFFYKMKKLSVLAKLPPPAPKFLN
jgi:hypothetical protein